jgi:alternate signal-mediated exported protein
MSPARHLSFIVDGNIGTNSFPTSSNPGQGLDREVAVGGEIVKKATKGAAAAAAAGVLLLGGAGSLAYWSDSQDAGTAAIKSGTLTLGPLDCTTNEGAHDWELDNGDTYVPGTTLIAPGDTISKVCDMDLTLDGAHIGATLGIATATVSGATGLTAELTPSATFLVDDAPYTELTAPGTHVVRATVSVHFKETADTVDSQTATAALDAITVTATQTHDTA